MAPLKKYSPLLGQLRRHQLVACGRVRSSGEYKVGQFLAYASNFVGMTDKQLQEWYYDVEGMGLFDD